MRQHVYLKVRRYHARMAFADGHAIYNRQLRGIKGKAEETK